MSIMLNHIMVHAPLLEFMIVCLGTHVWLHPSRWPSRKHAHHQPTHEPAATRAGRTYPSLSTAQIAGGNVTYAIQGPDDGPVILYFHGWGDDYRVALPLEYPLIDAGYQLLVVHRPGYAGTALEGIVDGETFDRRSAEGSAHTAAALLGYLYGDSWRISVIGTSGGAPAALAFASLYPDQTKALILQAGVAHAWTDAKFVPELFRATYLTAFKRFGWAGDQVSQIIFGLLVKMRDSTLSDLDRIRALVGSRLEEVKRDAAFRPAVSTILRDSPENRSGELNDAHRIFFSQSPYCLWESIKAPTRRLMIGPSQASKAPKPARQRDRLGMVAAWYQRDHSGRTGHVVAQG